MTIFHIVRHSVTWYVAGALMMLVSVSASAGLGEKETGYKTDAETVAKSDQRKLSAEFVSCIRSGDFSWIYCYNQEAKNSGDRQTAPVIKEGFMDFYSDMFNGDVDIRSIWVPSPAEYLADPLGRKL